MEDIVWNTYIDKHSGEPSNPQQLLNFSKRESKVATLGFTNARKLFERNNGKGKIVITANISTPKTKPTKPTKPNQTSKVVETDGLSLEEKYQALLLKQVEFEKENKKLLQNQQKYETENKQLREQLESASKSPVNTATANSKEKQKVWDEIMDYLIPDPDRVKSIVRRAVIDKVLDINEKDVFDQTLLMLYVVFYVYVAYLHLH